MLRNQFRRITVTWGVIAPQLESCIELSIVVPAAFILSLRFTLEYYLQLFFCFPVHCCLLFHDFRMKTIFMNMLDVAAVAAYVVWMEQMQDWNHGKSNKRHRFLSELSNQLVLPEQIRRFENPRAMQKGANKALELLGFQSTPEVPAASVGGPGRCHVCPPNYDRKVRIRCNTCNRHCCSDHSKVICEECGQE